MKRILAIAATIGLAAAWVHAVAQAPFAQQPPAAAQPKLQPVQRRPAPSPELAEPSSAARRRPSLNGAPGGRPMGPRTADIRDFGASTTTDSAAAIQRAYDSLISGGAVNGARNNVRGTLFIPSGVWPMGSPLIADGAFIDVIGERGAVLSCKASTILSYPVIAGQKRAVNWSNGDPHFGDSQLFPPDHRIDLLGKLDASLVRAPAQYFGLRSRSPSTHAGPNVASHWVQVWGSPPATGASDLWKDTRVFTLELAIENPRGAMGAVNICGMGAVGGTAGTSGAQGGPWTLSSDASQFIFNFNTLEGINGPPRSFRFGDSTLSGVQKLWVELDFSQNDGSGLCLIRAGQNGIQKAITRGQGTRQAQQNFNLSTHATGGSFALTGVRPDTNVQVTATIANNASVAAIQKALDTVYGAGNTLVAPGGIGAGFNWNMQGDLASLTTQVPLTDGTLLTGVTQPLGISAESGFTAAQMIHFVPNYLAPFWFFGDCFSGGDQLIAHGISVLNLYAFELSNCLRYASAGAGRPELRVDGVRPNTDRLRYALLDNNTIVAFNPKDPPHMPTKTWDGLVRFTLGAAAGVGGVDTFGWFNIALNGFPPPDDFANVQDQTYKQLRFESWGPMGGGGMYCHNLFNGRFDDCDFAGGWQGLTLFGGYDYSIRNAIGFGADAFLFAQTAMGQQTGVQRIAVGNTAYRFSGSFWDAQGLKIEASNLNQGMPGAVQDGFAQAGGASTITLATTASTVNNFYLNGTVRLASGRGFNQAPRTITKYDGATRVATVSPAWEVIPDATSAYAVFFPNALTEALIRVHPDGTYAYRYYFGALGTDNELPGGVPPLVHASRCSGTVGASLMRFNNFTTSGQGRSPAFLFDQGQTAGTFANYHPGNVWIHNLQTDGVEVAVDGPGWNVHIDTTELPLDEECIRYMGPQPAPAFPLHVVREALVSVFPPPAGRFVAGTVRLSIWNPEAGGVAEYRCTASGTAAWVKTHIYSAGAYCSFDGTEYLAKSVNVNNQPPSANWAALGPASPPTWKAVSTVAP